MFQRQQQYLSVSVQRSEALGIALVQLFEHFVAALVNLFVRRIGGIGMLNFHVPACKLQHIRPLNTRGHDQRGPDRADLLGVVDRLDRFSRNAASIWQVKGDRAPPPTKRMGSEVFTFLASHSSSQRR